MSEKIYSPQDNIKNPHIKDLNEYKALYEESINKPEKFFGKMATDNLQWIKPFSKIHNGNFAETKWFEDGTINISANCIDRHLKENSNKTNGIVYVHSSSFNQHNEKLLSWKRWVMIPKRDKNKTIKEVLPKNIKSEVEVKRMDIPGFLKTNNFDKRATGSSLKWEDYHENDEVNHSRGLTIDEASHTLATHLYQNDAKLHFNAHQMKSSPFKKRLVYGGHVISLCRSIAHEGFENNLIMTAIHAGTHSNPVLADDTLYAKTVITGKDELPDHQDIGVLKLKLIGIKNQIPSSLKSIYEENGESKIYNKNVVLDLDYSIVVPKGK